MNGVSVLASVSALAAMAAVATVGSVLFGLAMPNMAAPGFGLVSLSAGVAAAILALRAGRRG